MATEIKQLREFGRFRLDTGRKVLWHDGEAVPMPLKELELLCMLVDRHGELVTKDELLESVWAGSFVEESNLSRHIYLLRKTLKEFGEDEDLIQNVPRRGYRFAGEIHQSENGSADIVIEHHVLTRTLVEDISDLVNGEPGTENEKTVRENTKADRQETRIIRASRPAFRARTLVWSMVPLLVVTSGFAFWRSRTPAPSPAEIKSLAVLPFRDFGARAGEDHLGPGIADVLITRLSVLKGLNVRPTSAVMKFEGEDSVAAGLSLGVDAVLDGSVHRINNRVRVTARLVRVSDGAPVWGAQFDEKSEDLLAVQDAISGQLATALALNLTSGERQMLTRRYTESSDAFQLYLKGRHHWNKRNYEGMTSAESFFRQAIDHDPKFALAYVGLADTLATREGAWEFDLASRKAIELDPNLGEAYATRGFIEMFHRWDWKASEHNLRKSIELSPGYGTAHQWLATLLAITGRNAEAKAAMRRALEIDPLSANFLADMGQMHYFAREYAEAESYCRRALKISPDFHFAHQYLAFIYMKTGRHDEALEEYIKAGAALSADSKYSKPERVGLHTESYRKGGNGFLHQVIEHLHKSTNEPNAQYNIAINHALLGEHELALTWLERAAERRVFLLPFVKADPVFDNLRNDPRYQAILKNMRLDEF